MAENTPDALDGVGTNPTLDGVDEGQAQQPRTEDNLSELKETLDAYNISNPDDVTGLVNELTQFKKGFGDSQNEVGNLRRENEMLRQQLAQGMPQQQQQYQQQDAYSDPYEQGQPVDLESSMERVIYKVLGNVEQRNRQAQADFMRQKSDIMNRPGWNLVKDHFENALMNPDIASAINTGQLTLNDLYSRINERVLVNRVNKFVNSLPQDQITQQVAEPDKSDRVRQPEPAQLKRAREIERAKEAKDPTKLLETLIPDDDPIVRY